MSDPEPTIDLNHPLIVDRARLEKIKNKVHGYVTARMGRDALAGGDDAHDVVQNVVLSLLRTKADYAHSWERLAMTVAARRLADAYDKARQGRKHADEAAAREDPMRDPDAINLVSIDSSTAAEALNSRSTSSRENPEDDPEELLLLAEEQSALWDLAQTVLNERERTVYVQIFHKHADRADVAILIERTVRRVNQMIKEIHDKLAEAVANKPDFPRNDFPNRKPRGGGQ